MLRRTGAGRAAGSWPPEAGDAFDEARGPLAVFVQACRRIADTLAAEDGRWFLWLPVALCTGIGIYFALPQEPEGWMAILSAGTGAALLIRHVRRRDSFALLVVAGLLLGFALAKARCDLVAAPVVRYSTGFVGITGWVEQTQVRDDGRVRLVVRPTAIEGFAPDTLPFRLRLTGSRTTPRLAPGTHVGFAARLVPPLDPVAPGAHDFARDYWFDRIGGMGFAVIDVQAAETQVPVPWDLAITAAIDRLRRHIGDKVRAELSDPAAAIAVALINGERSAIGEPELVALRDSGLAHVLSISGLHMALAAGSLFWFVRAVLALVPVLALGFPIKKWAAVLALLGATFYLFISGAPVPAQRSYVMVAIMFLAIICDRPALSMRNLALSALAVLLLAPESVVNVSFQMSFMALVGLIATYEYQRNSDLGRSPARTSTGWLISRAGLYFGGIVLTTIVAGAATAPFGAFHFNRVAVYGVLGNLAGVPLTGLLIMPAALAGLLAMPAGLHGIPLLFMQAGIDAMLAAARWVAALPGAARVVPDMPAAAVVLMVAGFLWLCLWQRPWRFAGIALLLIGVGLAPFAPRPDVLIERTAANLALRGGDGRLGLASATSGRYSAGQWLLADGDDAELGAARDRGWLSCDAYGCVGTLGDGTPLAYLRHPAALDEECRRARIVVASFAVRGRCASADILIDRIDVWREGAHAIHRGRNGLVAVSTAESRGRRPWVTPPVSRRSVTAAAPADAVDP